MRLFVAFDLNEDVHERISLAVDLLRPNAPRAKWSKPQSWHVTLAFLGERPAEDGPNISAALALAMRSQRPLRLMVCGVDTFGPPASPSVLWIGITANAALTSLAEGVACALKPFAYVPEARGYTPHITLARSRFAGGDPGFVSCVKHLRATEFGDLSVDRVRLYNSGRASADGDTYGVISEALLGTVE